MQHVELRTATIQQPPTNAPLHRAPVVSARIGEARRTSGIVKPRPRRVQRTLPRASRGGLRREAADRLAATGDASHARMAR